MFLAQLGKMLPGAPDQIFANVHGVKEWVDTLKNTSLGKFTNSYFAEIEIFHFIGMFLIGAYVILTGLRMMGGGIKEESISTVDKNTRVFLHIGAIMALGTGLMMGVGNSGKLYASEIFTAKMIAMVAGLIFSYFVMVPVAKRDGVATTGTKVGGAIGMALWILALTIFAVRPTANVGWFHMIWGCSLILLVALQGKVRNLYIIVGLVLVIAWQVMTHVVVPVEDEKYMLVNKVFMYGTGVFTFGLALANIFGTAAAPGSNNFSRMIAYATILAWVTVGAGGRWIGLS